ncbi:MAG: hypothetical protein NC908_05175 [Candidatus Omnitrophica bacterium]|nr:hypothetical protein [Candidatus Omnitrophota bacterium]
MLNKLSGLATGIGSLPYKDPEKALDLIFKYCPQVPFWPQLPKRDVREGMVVQFSEGIPCLEISSAGVSFNPKDKDRKLQEFYNHIINEDVDYFQIGQNCATGLYALKEELQELKESRYLDFDNIRFLKLQIIGPFTFAASIKDERGIALLHDPVFMQAVSEGLTFKALWQIRQFDEFGKDIIIFVDEPYLGCFGSAYTPINREDVVKVLSDLTDRIHKSYDRVLVGVHCCGNTDWSIFIEINSIDIISFDAFGFLDKLLLYVEGLKRFFQQDRALCWGIVPTQDFNAGVSAELLLDKIQQAIEFLVKKGLEKEKILQNLLLSPSCGLGSLEESSAKLIFRLLSELVKKINAQ